MIARTRLATPSTQSSNKKRKLNLDDQHISAKKCDVEQKNNSPTSITATTFEEPTSYSTSMKHVEMIDDVMLHIMGFFVGTDSIDRSNILELMHVSKRWNELSTSTQFWRSVPSIRTMPCDHLSTRLIQYAKIEQMPRSQFYKVRDRKTNKIMQLEISPSSESDNSATSNYKKRHLREMAMSATMQDQEEKKYLNLLIDTDVCDGYSLHWHEYSHFTLTDLLQERDMREKPEDIKHVVCQVLRGLQILSHSGFVHGSLDLDCIEIANGNARDVQDEFKPNIRLSQFGSSKKTNFLCIEKEQETVSANDMVEVGKLILSMLRFDGKYNVKKIMGKNGVDFLKKCLGTNIKNQTFSIHNALEHSYFVDTVLSPSSEEGHKSCLYKNMQHSESANYSSSLCESVVNIDDRNFHGMVDWLFEIATVFTLHTRTVYSAVAYYNVCCQNSIFEKINPTMDTLNREIRNKHQLVAATCLYIASKCNDGNNVDAHNLSFSADRTFAEEDVYTVEPLVLEVLKGKLQIPLVYDFLQIFTNKMGYNERKIEFWLAMYISDLVLASTTHLKYQPSVIASSTLLLSRYSLTSPEVWPQQMETFTGLNICELKNCILEISRVLDNMRQNMYEDVGIIHRRYKSSKRMNVSSSRTTIRTIKSNAAFEMLLNSQERS